MRTEAPYSSDQIFAIVLARDRKGVKQKTAELTQLGLPHIIICGENLRLKNAIYRPPRGKFDAINCAINQIPKNCRIVVLNDVDTTIVNFESALANFRDSKVGFVFARVEVPSGAPSQFNEMIDGIRRRFIIAANGELNLLRREVLLQITPLPPCKAEDTFMLFETMRRGYKVVFETRCYCITSRTTGLSLRKEERFKRKVVCGIFQALHLARAPLPKKMFYSIVPFASPLLLVTGRRGFYWMRGIIHGTVDFLKGDRTGIWSPDYK